MTEEKLNFKSGVTSTKQPRLSLIPHQGLVNAAKRFEKGLERHGEGAWNNLSTNQEALKDEEWLIERCSHAIEHLYRLIDFLSHKEDSIEQAAGDAGAVAWCGLVLGQALFVKSPFGNRIITAQKPQEVASNLDNVKCTACGEILKAYELISETPEGYMHKVCPEIEITSRICKHGVIIGAMRNLQFGSRCICCDNDFSSLGNASLCNRCNKVV